MKIIRVFPRRTSMTPDDPTVFVGDPPLGLWRPEADEVHISVTFTWDISEGRRLRDAWAQYYDVVRIGGPAFDDCNDLNLIQRIILKLTKLINIRSPFHDMAKFTPGLYIKPGVTFTTRGCNNKCPWCLVPEREGKLQEIRNFAPGHIIQDNNILQASKCHLQDVAEMLHTQPKAAVFSGGIQASLIDTWTAAWIKGLRIKEIFLAADTSGALPALRRAVDKLEFLGRNSNKLRCYVMIGYNGETIEQATERLEAVWDAGCVPFAQLYQPDDHYIKYSSEWKALARTWSRPAAMRAMHKITTGDDHA